MAMGRAGPQNLPVHSVFFGGGTPSLLTGIQVKNVLDTIRQYYILLPDAEITVEANPGTVKLDTLQAWFQEGVNRLSFGMQSAHPEELRLLQRQHSFFDVIQAISWARKAGYANLNLDLIFGLPEQTLDHWQKSIAFALNLKPEHLSLYALTVEEGTPLNRWVNHGLEWRTFLYCESIK
jgi:oxygen-independent coproporphyrinogen III oxidase